MSTCKPIILFFLFSLLFTSTCFSQQLQKYSVFKLENKIGTENISTSILESNTTYDIVIQTNDRGLAMLLSSKFSSFGSEIKFNSMGHTSRFKKETIDTGFKASSGFPLSQNGSIKMRELLISSWLKVGKPQTIKSALNGKEISITEMLKEESIPELKEFKAFRIHHDLDEIFWIDGTGKGIFLTATDSEGDKREVISNDNLPLFQKLNHQSTQYLLNAYQEQLKSVAKQYDLIAILGGNIIDVVRNGEIINNTLILIKNGKLDYVGTLDRSLIPPNAHLIDASNKYLLPGLWDMHVHLFHPDYLNRALLSGATTVRDMGNELDFISQLKALANKSTMPLPRIYTAGLIDGKSANALGNIQVKSKVEIEEAVKKYHELGFEQIKVYDYLKKSDFNTIVTEAKRYNMQVVGHLPIGYTLPYFANNGMNSFSHIRSLMNSLNWSSPDLKATNKELLDHIKAKNIYLDPTLNVFRLTGDKRIAAYERLVKLMFDYGIPIVAGTDNEGTIAEEIQTYAKLGLKPIDAIRAATIVPAQVMGAEKESGSIEQGKNASVLILDENPLINIGTLQQIRSIINGQFIIR